MDKLDFTILWYNGGPEHAPNRCIGRSHIRATDLTSAIRTAGKWIGGKWPVGLPQEQRSSILMAHGFYVRKSRSEEIC